MTRRQLLALAASASVLRILRWDGTTFARAAEPMADSPVAVTKMDGTVVKGKVVNYGREKLTLVVTGKPKDPPANVDIPWDQIKRVSNGLTREKGLQKWKADHLDSLCATCHGDGKIFCPTCHGTGHDPAASAGCPTCKGAAQIVCTTAKCNHGTIPCPNPKCLKLTDGGWYKKPDGLRWKKFPIKNGYAEWSEHHLGQVIEKVGGEWQNLGTCPVCGGVTTISDPVCRGSGNMPCPVCSKKTKNPACPNKCDAGVVQCPACQGSGLKA